MNINGNTVLITGGATGIGYALAEAFLKAGNDVIICGRRKEKLLEAQRKLPELHIKVCDITIDSARRDLFEWIKKNFSNLNILINNAGIQREIDLKKGEQDLLQGESEIEINFKAPVYLTALFIPLLMEKENAAIINITTRLATDPIATMPLYCATKGAIHIFSVTLREQLADTSVKVFEAIAPMILDTELNLEGRAKRGISQTNMSTPTSAEYAGIVLKGIQQNSYEIRYDK